MSCCTAMMSARGTMTSSIRRSRSARMFLSMVRSSGENAGARRRRRFEHVLRGRRGSSPIFQPNIARASRAKKPSPPSRATSLGRGTGTGRLRSSLDCGAGSVGRLAGRNQAWRSVGPACQVRRARRIRIGHAEPRQDSRSRRSIASASRRFRGRSRADGEIHARRDGRDDARTACLRRPPRARSSRRRSRCRRACVHGSAGARRRQRETTARWSARPCRANRG